MVNGPAGVNLSWELSIGGDTRITYGGCGTDLRGNAGLQPVLSLQLA
jgi:hypothetical protein